MSNVKNLIRFLNSQPDHIDRVVTYLLDSRACLPNGDACPKLSRTPLEITEYIRIPPREGVTLRERLYLVKILEMLENRLDRNRFGSTYIEVVRALKAIAEDPELVMFEEQDSAYRTWILTKWINLCLQANVDRAVQVYLQHIGIDPEVEIRNIVFDPGKTVAHVNLRPELYLPQILNWFLKRYDLATAAKLVYEIGKLRHEPKKSQTRLLSGASVLVLLAAALVSASLWMISGGAAFVANASGWWHSWALDFSGNGRFLPTAILWVYLLVAAVIVIAALRGRAPFLRRIPISSKLLIPRLLGGIIVGYLPILFSDETWRTLNNLPELQGVLLFALAVSFCGLYLFWEVRNVISDRTTAGVRALTILSLGLLESFAIGLVVLDLMTVSFLKKSDLAITTDKLEPGLFGDIYPKMLLLYFPLALLIGIFVQIIWEDKPVTHPL